MDTKIYIKNLEEAIKDLEKTETLYNKNTERIESCREQIKLYKQGKGRLQK